MTHVTRFIALAGLGGLTACMTTPATDADGAAVMLGTQAQFEQAIVGRTLAFEGNTFMFNADGTFSGPWNGDGISGTWTWVDGAACREGRIGTTRTLDLDCQIWSVAGSQATVTRDRGNGASFVYDIR